MMMVEVLTAQQSNDVDIFLNSTDSSFSQRFWLGLKYNSPSATYQWITSRTNLAFSKNSLTGTTSKPCVKVDNSTDRTWLIADCTWNEYALCQQGKYICA